MLDARLIRERPDDVREAMRRRGALGTLASRIDRGVELDQERRLLIQAVEERKAARNASSQEVARRKKAGETVEEKVSLSDRFGLWLGFHRCSQDEYLAMVEGYVGHFKIPVAADDLRREALEWATTRGSRSGRVAWQYVQDLAGRLGVKLSG